MSKIGRVEKTLTDAEGNKRTYTISKFDAISGRAIAAQYVPTAAPKIGDYEMNEKLMYRMMTFVYVQTAELLQPLDSRAMIENHVPDWEKL